jgi:tripartite-type tricarboxylate transporter receptor subunit TctC
MERWGNWLAKIVAAAISCLVPAAEAPAQTFPARVVKLVVPQAPGGATDVFARKLGQMLSEKWGQPVVVENRAGVAGVLGTEFVAKAAGDGYTLLITYAGSQAVNPSLYPNLPFDSVKDFAPIATIASTPFLLIANPKLPAKSLQDFVALARAKPGGLTFASSGIGSVNHLIGEMLKADAKIDIVHVPYRGVAAAITDVIAGHVDTAFSTVPSVLPFIRDGQVRALAVSSAKRVDAAADVPTIAEQGFPGFAVDPWWGILAPAKTDPAIVRKISADVADIVRSKPMVDFLAGQGAAPLIETPDEFAATLARDVATWAKVIKAANIKLE